MEALHKTAYQTPLAEAVFVQMEGGLLEGSTTQGTIHSYVYEENAWEDEQW